MFAAQQKRSAFISFRSATSATPEMSSPALSPMRKKLSTSQNLDNSSPNTIDHVSHSNCVLFISLLVIVTSNRYDWLTSVYV